MNDADAPTKIPIANAAELGLDSLLELAASRTVHITDNGKAVASVMSTERFEQVIRLVQQLTQN